MSSVYDLIVIGSGPAGQRAAIYAAKLGKKVALVEMREVVGGANTLYLCSPRGEQRHYEPLFRGAFASSRSSSANMI